MYRAVKEKKCAWAPSYYLRMGGSRKIRNVKAVVRRAIYVTRGGGHVKYRGGGVFGSARKCGPTTQAQLPQALLDVLHHAYAQHSMRNSHGHGVGELFSHCRHYVTHTFKLGDPLRCNNWFLRMNQLHPLSIDLPLTVASCYSTPAHM